jgi:hypothetical protein
LSSAQLCSPHLHLNMRTVRPFRGLSIVRSKAGFSPQLLHAGTRLGSKLEKTSFLNSSLMRNCPLPVDLSYKVNIGSGKAIPPCVCAWNDSSKSEPSTKRPAGKCHAPARVRPADRHAPAVSGWDRWKVGRSRPFALAFLENHHSSDYCRFGASKLFGDHD